MSLAVPLWAHELGRLRIPVSSTVTPNLSYSGARRGSTVTLLGCGFAGAEFVQNLLRLCRGMTRRKRHNKALIRGRSPEEMVNKSCCTGMVKCIREEWTAGQENRLTRTKGGESPISDVVV
ncbi:hypothetical protein RvY_03570 [Ramazzottius varieornatus]|uniref:Uncharacterized protein n=1 Tax=Ramazzottius varieornatus TaxID=947166 RepID=A0A1D1US97_RAMVA|nr:hypothetical protein RvY_03570 [Ramazzottius varieornatus]